MALRVEPSPAGGYVVRLEGHDVPVSRHDTEEEAEAWAARHAGGLAATERPGRQALRPHFAGLPDGTQVLLRSPLGGDRRAAPGARVVAVDPRSGTVIGWIGDDGTHVADAWSARGLDAVLVDVAV